MNSKAIIWICVAVGSYAGSAIPMLWGAGMLSFSSIILSGVGGLFGVYVGYRLSNW
jgi:hypothetical protein